MPVDDANLNIDSSQSLKYKATLEGKAAGVDNGNSFVKNTKIVAPLKYLRNFWRSIEIPLINDKVCFELNWIINCILSSTGDSSR